MFKYTLKDKKNRKLICVFRRFPFTSELYRILIIFLIDFDDIHEICVFFFFFFEVKQLIEIKYLLWKTEAGSKQKKGNFLSVRDFIFFFIFTHM